jgi:HK97 family phage major capsid protein
MATMATTQGTVKALHLDVDGVAPKDVIPEALILKTSSKAGFVPGDEPQVRVPFISLEDQPHWIQEGALVHPGTVESTEVNISTGKVGIMVGVSREQYAQGQAATLLSDAVRSAIIRKSNRLYLSQVAPVAPDRNPPAGLTAQGLTDGGTLGAALDEFADAVATIESAGGNANFVLAHPLAWAAITKLKSTADSNVSLIGAGVDAAQRQLLGVPVYADRDVPAGTIIVGDKNSILSAYGDLQLAVSQDALFEYDSVGIRATWRFGAKVADVARVVQITVPGVTAPAVEPVTEAKTATRKR